MQLQHLRTQIAKDTFLSSILSVDIQPFTGHRIERLEVTLLERRKASGKNREKRWKTFYFLVHSIEKSYKKCESYVQCCMCVCSLLSYSILFVFRISSVSCKVYICKISQVYKNLGFHVLDKSSSFKCICPI